MNQLTIGNRALADKIIGGIAGEGKASLAANTSVQSLSLRQQYTMPGRFVISVVRSGSFRPGLVQVLTFNFGRGTSRNYLQHRLHRFPMAQGLAPITEPGRAAGRTTRTTARRRNTPRLSPRDSDLSEIISAPGGIGAWTVADDVVTRRVENAVAKVVDMLPATKALTIFTISFWSRANSPTKHIPSPRF